MIRVALRMARCAVATLATLALSGATAWSAEIAWRPMTFSIQGPGRDCPTCYWVLADGHIDAQAPTRFAEFLEREPGAPKLIRLNSEGGLAVHSMRLGQMIREAGFDTVVGPTVAMTETGAAPVASACYSACTIVFLGGVHRKIAASASFGVHRLYFTDPAAIGRADVTKEEMRQAKAVVEFALRVFVGHMGVDLAFVDLTMSTAEIHELTPKERSRLGVVTSRRG
jgi:hypothetical protein